MKIRLIDGIIHNITRAEVINGRLEIDIADKTAEEMQDLFSMAANLKRIELLTDEENMYGDLTGWTVYGGVMLNGDTKTAILTKPVDVTEERLTSAEADALAAKTATEKQAEEIEQIKREIAEGGAGVDQELFAATAVVARANAQALPGAQALEAKVLYDTFDNLVAVGYTAEKQGFKFRDGDDLYKTAQDNVTFQAQYRPGDGTESLYTRIDEIHAGTLEDPIPYAGNMALENGKYYSQDGVIYLCTRDTEIPVYQALADLVGLYVEIAE